MNTNWARILLFTLLGFALGFIISCLTCGRCGRGGCGKGTECHAGAATCAHDGGSGEGSCCKHGGHGKGHDDHGVHAVVHELEAAGFQGDTTIAIGGGTVNVRRAGDSTSVKVEVHKKKEVSVEHVH